ncbi:MAG: glutamine amidotransferase [Methylococcaceae bacterium]|jgi:GMP synthase (glutamine-hydrolysing)
MKKRLIIKTGSTFPEIKHYLGDFEDWISTACGLSASEFLVVNVAAGQALPAIESISSIIITGSPAMVTEQKAWMQQLALWLPRAIGQRVPLLGICFGHQILAQALGGSVGYHAKGREIGTVSIGLTNEGKQDILFGHMPDIFMAHVTHAQSVLKLPAQARLLAGNAYEAQHAFSIGPLAWGVQFHPEFSTDIMQAYINVQETSLSAHGCDVNALIAEICPTHEANALLKRFIAIAG